MHRKKPFKRKAACANYQLPPGTADRFKVDLEKAMESLTGFRGEYLRQEIFSKYLDDSKVPAHKRKQAAIDKWLATERTNEETNMRLFEVQSEVDHPYMGVIRNARHLIKSVLGRLQLDCNVEQPRSPFWEEAIDRLSITGGASTQFPRSPTGILEKLSGVMHVSDSAFWHYLYAFETTHLDGLLVERNQSDMFTVAKKDDIDRVACKEPEANMILQRACGIHIRERLRKVGIDLTSQYLNQSLAHIALDCKLATVDLSAASDSVTHSLVQLLLPFEWYALLDDLRVPDVKLPDGTIHEMEMFSTMGNGFTFELETLIFWALAKACCMECKIVGTVAVYGDDIVVPSKVGPALAHIFKFFGFTVNEKKSNWTGRFRESCGCHYYDSCDVTPVYIRGPVTKVRDLILALNSIFRWSATLSDGTDSKVIWDPALAKLHEEYSSLVSQRLWGGYDLYSDAALVTGHAPRKRLMPRTKRCGLDHLEYGRLVHRLISYKVGGLPVRTVGYKEGSNRGVHVSDFHGGTTFSAHQYTGELHDPWLLLRLQ